jgi:hypothetical protein
MVSKEGDQVTVAEGDVQATVHESKLTNDLDVVDKLRARIASEQTSATDGIQSAPTASESSTPNPTPTDQQRRLAALKKSYAQKKYNFERLQIQIDHFGADTGSKGGTVAPVQMRNAKDKLERELELLDLEIQRQESDF